MFKKILIVEDVDSIGAGIVSALEKTMPSTEVSSVHYCDEAYLKVRRAQQDGQPFDLLITDLSFEPDHREAKLKGGRELIEKINEQGINIAIIVYSIEDRKTIFHELFDTEKVGGYVLKGRNSIQQLQKAILALAEGQRYCSPPFEHGPQKSGLYELEAYDISILLNLSKGFSQNEIAEKFKDKGIRPSGLSSIEKRINRLKEEFEAKNATQLVAIAKDLGFV